jgi:hypothetical protein
MSEPSQAISPPTTSTKTPKAQKLVGVKGMNDILPPDFVP